MRRPPLLALTAAPVVLLGVATYVNWSEAGGAGLTALLASLGAATGVCALVFALDAARMRRAFAHLRAGGAALGYEAPRLQQLRDRRHHETVARLRRQVELLSAIRDLALIANDDVSFERILERSLVVLRGLLAAREITIFLVERPDEALVPVAQLLRQKTRVRGGRTQLSVEPCEARQAYEERRTVLEPHRGGLRAASLLVADGALMGALEVRLPRPVGPARDPWEVGRELEALAKHIALAIRKPTLYDRAVVDALTGLYTKRHFLEQVQQHMAQRVRLGTPLSLIILDVDHFKKVNDTHGHVAGDLVLAEVATRLRREIRGYDQAFRYGGEEMIVLAPNTPLADAARLAERLRQKVRGAAVDAGDEQITVTASFGVVEHDPAAMAEPGDLVEAADQHLYRAKEGGRDQVQSPLTAEAAPAQAA